jgi:phage terminase large subunit-like protein
MDKPSYPDLRAEAIQANNDFAPDKILIEKKASGHSLRQELKRKNLPIIAVKLGGSAGRGRKEGDLIARAHEASLMLEKGCIWYPPRRWALEVIEKSSKFPNGPPGSRDIVSTLAIAWQYMRKFYDLQLPDDEKDEISPWAWRKRETQKPKRYA